MSNLIKSVYFNVDPSQIRTIDSDQRVEEYIPNIYNQPKAKDAYEFPSFDDEDGEGFEGGLSVISMDDVVNEERERLSAEMQEERNGILSEAREEAEAILAKAREDAAVILEAAKTEGFQKGTEEARVQMSLELEKMREELQNDYEEKLTELDLQEKNLEPAFADLVVSLVKKITGVLCEDKREIILYLIGSAMKNMEKTSSITIRVSKRDISIVSAKKSTLKMLAKDVSSFDILEDASLTENQCIIETDNKIIDCSLDAELQNLEEHIKLLVY